MKEFLLEMRKVNGKRIIVKLEGTSIDKISPIAGKIVRAWIERHNISGSAFGYAFLFDNRKLSAFISYNGRIWVPEEYASLISADSWQAKMMIKAGYTGEFQDC